jgi:predicted amidohydrolase
MADVLRALAIEVPARWAQPDATLAWVRRTLHEVDGGVDLVVLPEACLTGYVSPLGVFDPTALAEPLDGPTLRAVADIARARKVHVVAPLIERAPGSTRLYNACFVVAPTGEVVAHYRKRHPWYPEAWATAGDGPHPVFELGGVRLTLAICFDVHFLAEKAKEALSQADALIFPSAWVQDEGATGDSPARDTRADELAALARAFDVAIVNANWGAGDVRIAGQGGSRVVGRDGRELDRARPGRPWALATLTCDVARTENR